MKAIWALTLVLELVVAGAAGQVSSSGTAVPVRGNWEGESKCTVADSPCHDERVVYEIKTDAHTAGKLLMDAYKIVAGAKQFMGTLDCRYRAEESTLSCVGRRPDDLWVFAVSGDQMKGTLTIGADKQLYRRIEVKRTKGQ